MFSKKIMILKSDIQKLNNLICKLEKNQNEINVSISNNLNLDGANKNLFCLILDSEKDYNISQFSPFENTYACKFKNDFDLNSIFVFIFEFENNSINILALNNQSKLSDVEKFIVNERGNILSKIHSLLGIEQEQNIEMKSLKLENDCDKDCSIENSDKCNECFYKQEYFKLISQNSTNTKINTISDLDTDVVTLNNEDIKLEDCAVVEEKIESNESKPQSKLDFYHQVEKTINHLFETKSTDDILESYIEESKFVKVEYEETKDYYSVGVIYENQIPKYICYAFPCQEGSAPPENLAEFAQFLPIGNQKGYYLMYQDAKTGENIIVQSI